MDLYKKISFKLFNLLYHTYFFSPFPRDTHPHELCCSYRLPWSLKAEDVPPHVECSALPRKRIGCGLAKVKFIYALRVYVIF